MTKGEELQKNSCSTWLIALCGLTLLGAGLGLAIVQTIVNRFGGRLELANIAPQGFEARLILPLVTD